MKKCLKSVLSLAFSLIMIVCTLAFGGAIAFAEEYETGDYIYFGSYPQSRVTDTALVSALNSAGGSWVSYGYYSGNNSAGTMKSSDYMKYKDVSYNGEKYRAVTFSNYRPRTTTASFSESNTIQSDNGYTTGNVYWFKYEPLKWKVLDADEGLIMCSSIIDSQAYNNCYYCTDDSQFNVYSDSAMTNYASDYATSSIRQWLNDDFYNIAFSSDDKENIKISTLNNDGYYTITGGVISNPDLAKFDSASTNDRVFMLSYDEVLNTSYGFADSYRTADTARKLSGTDYAYCQGLNTWTSGPEWYHRTPGKMAMNVCYTNGDGTLIDSMYSPFNSDATDYGVVPALRLKSFNDEYSHCYDKTVVAPTCTEDGYTRKVCKICGYDTGKTDIISATGHSRVTYSKEATCTEEGFSSREWCSVCGTIFVDGEIIPKTEHTINTLSKEPTCTTDGYTDREICSVCKTIISSGTSIPATGHGDLNKDGYCDVCKVITDIDIAYPCNKTVISVATSKSVDYKSKVVIKATATNVPDGYCLAIYVNGKQAATGDNIEVTYTVNQITSDLNYTVKVVDSNGNVQKDASYNDLTEDGGKIACDSSFIKKLVAFFKGLFGSLPTVTVKP